ncbi:MAG: hypothetical protein QNJ54_36270 [Prochloraceae cyanobacterium]|nr:hypothetical protein [Prochloraceae cyanobacterium]
MELKFNNNPNAALSRSFPPPTIAAIFSKYRDIFCRQEGFDHVSRYITGLLLSPNKTLEGIHSQQIWSGGKEVKRRAMHAAVFEASWKSEELMPRHREVVARDPPRERERSNWD